MVVKLKLSFLKDNFSFYFIFRFKNIFLKTISLNLRKKIGRKSGIKIKNKIKVNVRTQLYTTLKCVYKVKVDSYLYSVRNFLPYPM